MSTQKIYLRAVRDLMESLGSIPEKLEVERIKAYLALFRGKLSSSALNSRVCGIKYYFRKVVKRSRLKREIHPHTFRHSFAVHYINNGGSILRLKGLLGHEYMDATLHYLEYCSIPLRDTPTPLSEMLKRRKKGKKSGNN